MRKLQETAGENKQHEEDAPAIICMHADTSH
jgi:hypothetical protein